MPTEIGNHANTIFKGFESNLANILSGPSKRHECSLSSSRRNHRIVVFPQSIVVTCGGCGNRLVVTPLASEQYLRFGNFESAERKQRANMYYLGNRLMNTYSGLSPCNSMEHLRNSIEGAQRKQQQSSNNNHSVNNRSPQVLTFINS